MTHTKAYRLALASFIVLWRRIPYMFFAFLCLYGSGWLISKAYYRYMPASWFLTLTQPAVASDPRAPYMANGSVGKDLTLTFCRKTRSPDIKAAATRSFYLYSDGHFSPAGDYDFIARIEGGERCQYIGIKPANHPNKAGRYSSHTELVFYVNGVRKVLSYDTNQFTISDTADSLQKRIEDLQHQINELKLQSRAPVSNTVAATAAPAVAAEVFRPGVTISRQNTDTTRPTAPPTSSPPSPPNPPVPVLIQAGQPVIKLDIARVKDPVQPLTTVFDLLRSVLNVVV